jgi:hypothetical protein
VTKFAISLSFKCKWLRIINGSLDPTIPADAPPVSNPLPVGLAPIAEGTFIVVSADDLFGFVSGVTVTTSGLLNSPKVFPAMFVGLSTGIVQKIYPTEI